MSTISSVRLKAGIPGTAPAWYREGWKGVQVSLVGAAQVPNSNFVLVLTSVAIDSLRKHNAGAAHYWMCCLAGTAGPTMSFPHSICEPISDEPAAAPYFRGKEHPPYLHGAGINKN